MHLVIHHGIDLLKTHNVWTDDRCKARSYCTLSTGLKLLKRYARQIWVFAYVSIHACRSHAHVIVPMFFDIFLLYGKRTRKEVVYFCETEKVTKDSLID